MKFKYQLILIGNKSAFLNDIKKSISINAQELGLNEESILILDAKNFWSQYISNVPTFGLYFGDNEGKFKHLNILSKLIKDANLILPIVQDIRKFTSHTPNKVHGINGFQLADNNDIEKLVSLIFEGLGLLRLSRRLFISYKRDESTGVAIQLYEKLEKNGFDVFLDTHSIRPGEPFQDELWHRLADTDVVLLLNTPGFLKSNWTTMELAQANAMSIGILQLIWPTHELEREAEISLPYKLTDDDFESKGIIDAKSYLKEAIIEKIVNKTESLRARSLGARQDNIVSEFMNVAHKLGKQAYLQPEKFITLRNDSGKELIIIPTVGVPQAFTYYRSDEFYNRILNDSNREVFLVYDQFNIRERWLNHLSWLDTYLPVKTIKVTEIEKWLRNL